MNILDDLTTEAGSPAGCDTKEFIPSERQQAVFDLAEKQPDQDILIQAVAGSGKSTTLIKTMEHAPGSSLFMAFNKAIAEDIRRKATTGDVKTLNALGHGLQMQNAGGTLNAKKNQEILKKLVNDQEFLNEHGYTISRAIGLAKNNAFGIDGNPEGPESFAELIEAYLDVDSDRLDEFADLAYEAFNQGRNRTEDFDFDDQLYLPLLRGDQFPFYSNTLVDECQDLSPIQHIMLERLKARGSRIIAVGDRHQAIYGFRGAKHDSMDDLKELFKMTELPLDISYRCPQSVVEEAQFFSPDIKAHEKAPLGSVKRLSPVSDRDPLLFENQLIVCRNNAPLFAAILRHVRARKPCIVLSNFLDSFQSFVRSFKTVYTSDLMVKVDKWYEKESAAAKAKGFRGKLAALSDKYETVKLLCAEFKRTEDVIAMVKRLGSGTAGPTFATIHKAKGLEHENVYLLRPDLLPAIYAQSPEQKQQEANLEYVAITRSALNLTYGVPLNVY